MKKSLTVIALAIALSASVLAGEINGSYVPPPPCAPSCPGAMVQDDPVEDFIISIFLALITRR